MLNPDKEEVSARMYWTLLIKLIHCNAHEKVIITHFFLSNYKKDEEIKPTDWEFIKDMDYSGPGLDRKTVMVSELLNSKTVKMNY